MESCPGGGVAQRVAEHNAQSSVPEQAAVLGVPCSTRKTSNSASLLRARRANTTIRLSRLWTLHPPVQDRHDSRPTMIHGRVTRKKRRPGQDAASDAALRDAGTAGGGKCLISASAPI